MNIAHKYIYLIFITGVLMMATEKDVGFDNALPSLAANLEPDRKVCVGRFLLNVPKVFKLSFGDTRISGVQISSDDTERQEDFEKRLIFRERELAIDAGESTAGLERIRDVKLEHVRGKVFYFGRQKTYHFEHGKKIDSEWFSIEAHVRIKEISYWLFVEIAGDEQVKIVDHIIANMRQRNSDEVPEYEGFCFENGIVLGATASPRKVESTVLFAGDPRRPDLAFALSSMSGVVRQKNLLQRKEDSPTRREYRTRFQTLFEGRRAINGIPGEEVSEAVRELKGTRGHTFMWESDSVTDDVLKPFLSLELSTGIGRPGEPVNSSLTDKEVQMLWEKISNSLRLRPVSPSSSEETPVKQVPSSASAGTPCPRSGWWSCAEHADKYEVDGGTVQYFSEGVRMPETKFLGPKKVFGRRLEFELGTPTRWKFVREQA